MTNKSGFSVLRKAALLGGVGLFALAGQHGTISTAEAREDFGYFNPYGYRGEMYDPQADFRRAPRATKRKRNPPAEEVRKGNKGKQADKKTPSPPPGPHMLIVSIKSQRIALYSNGKEVANSPISSGVPSNPTPHGVFSIIQRNRHHRSNIYSGAPMPYMQRLTWSGIALHQGALPGHPASHGCIRLPESFANFLWNTTKMNTRVIVARDDVEPNEIVHAKLFQPKAVPTTVESPLKDLRKTLDTTHQFTRTAGMQMLIVSDAVADDSEKGDSKPLVREPAAQENAAKMDAGDAQPVLQSADRKPAAVELPVAEPKAPAREETQPAVAAPRQQPVKEEVAAPQPAPQPEPVKQEVAAPQPAKPDAAAANAAAPKPEPKVESKVESKVEPKIEPKVGAKIDNKADITATVIPQRADIPDQILASFERSLTAKEKKSPPSGPVSVFISRKDKKLYVRQAFIPLFTADVTFKNENEPFGTHVFTAYNVEDGKPLRWTVVTMPAEAPVAEVVKTVTKLDARGRRVEVAAKPAKSADIHPIPSPASVLDRIDIPKDVADRISEYMTGGSSLIVADQGLGYETGLYTDFIVVTKK